MYKIVRVIKLFKKLPQRSQEDFFMIIIIYYNNNNNNNNNNNTTTNNNNVKGLNPGVISKG